MKVCLVDVDGHNYPNIPLMKISAYHKSQGDMVMMHSPMFSEKCDIAYVSKVFSFTPDYPWNIDADEIRRGGTGYAIRLVGGKEAYDSALDVPLPSEIEHSMPDYSLYGITDNAYGFLTRGCPRGCPFCHVAAKEGRKSVQVADLSEFWSGQRNITLCDPNILACRDHERLLKQLAESNAYVDFNQGVDVRLITNDNIALINSVKMKTIHFAWDLMEQSESVLRGLQVYAKRGRITDSRKRRVFVLVNFNSTWEDDIYRTMTLRELGYAPYTMIYDKQHAERKYKDLQRWTNAVWIWRTCETFEEYGKIHPQLTDNQLSFDNQVSAES